MATNYTRDRFFSAVSNRASHLLVSIWDRCCGECGWDASYPASTDVALAGVKELAERVVELEARIEGLHAQIDRLERSLEAVARS